VARVRKNKADQVEKVGGWESEEIVILTIPCLWETRSQWFRKKEWKKVGGDAAWRYSQRDLACPLKCMLLSERRSKKVGDRVFALKVQAILRAKGWDRIRKTIERGTGALGVLYSLLLHRVPFPLRVRPGSMTRGGREKP